MKRSLFTVVFFCFFSIANGGEPANTKVIDAFGYADTAAARAVWTAMYGEKGPDIEMVAAADGVRFQFSAPFASKPEQPRFSVDGAIDIDLSAAASFTLRVKGSLETDDSRFSIYFHSGDGWYSGSFSGLKSGWRTLSCKRDAFVEEGAPAGWDKVDRVRISVWPSDKSAAKDTSFQLDKLSAHWNGTAILLPEPDSSEYEVSEAAANRMATMLQQSGVESDRLRLESISLKSLAAHSVAILAHNPQLSDAALKKLDDYVVGGGKILVCYSMPHKLAASLGFKPADYFLQKQSGDFAAIHFDSAAEFSGLPETVQQASWNIKTATPVAYNARVIGNWLDRDGKLTGKPAMLVSDRGAFFSHVVLADDFSNKTAMLTAILGKMEPGLWKEAVGNVQLNAGVIGHCQNVEELKTLVGDGSGSADFAEAEKTMALSNKLLKEGDGAAAYAAANRAWKSRGTAYLKAQTSSAKEARAFWNHSGTGAYPGDWDRTAREMAAAGMNMILPNMLWGGQAHYPSDVLLRSETFAEFGDQIEQCLAAGKKHGIEVHVWKVNFNLGHGVPQEYIDKLRKAGRLQISSDGEPGDWLNPAHPENFKQELESILEVVRKYDIDGFHFDYIRYPNANNDFSEYSREKFQADTGITVKNWPADCHSGPLQEAYTDWRCGNITRLVKAVSEQARKIRPGIKISAAVFREYPACRKSVAQDWPLWAKEGYIDFLCPMDYTDDDEKYTEWLTAQKGLLPEGFPLYPGIGISLRTKTQTADRVAGQIYLNRKVGTGGFTIFDMNADTLKEVSRAMVAGTGKTKAFPPHREKK